jgi:hypothetical protein
MLLIAALAALTWQRATGYKDEATLFSHIAGLNPNEVSAQANLNVALKMLARKS